MSDPDSHDESCSVCDCVCAADVNHYKENECMRLAMEDVLYNNGVDIVLNGHCHEYERSNPVYVSYLVSKHASACATCCTLLLFTQRFVT